MLVGSRSHPMFETLQKWRDARQHLDSAIQSYLESVAALNSNLLANLKAIDVNSLEKIALEAQHDSRSMEHRFETLQKGRSTLNRMRNKAASLVQINKLPYEILLEIFRLCTAKNSLDRNSSMLCSGWHYSVQELIILTHVCADWRKALVSAPSFWAHIDTDFLDPDHPSGSFHRIQMSLERAGDFPLCFDFTFPTREEDQTVSTFPTSTFRLLQPHVNKLRSVYLREWNYDTELLELFSLWFQNAQAGSIRNFALWSSCPMDPFSSNPCRNDQEDALLLPIQSLHLNGIAFNWESSAYRNLVHLKIGCLLYENCPRLDQIIDILASCQELYTLQLTDMWVRESNRPQLQPTILRQLRTLDLDYLNDESLGLLLPLLVVPLPNLLNLRTALLPSSTRPGSAVQSFLARTIITSLYIHHFSGVHGIAIKDYLAAAQNLTFLILDLFWGGEAELLPILTSCLASLCPRLHTLHLCNGTFTDGSIENLCKACPSLNKLRLLGCNLSPSDVESIGRIRRFVPDVDIDSIARHRFVETCWYNIEI